MSYVRAPQVTERETSHLWVDERSMDDARWEDCGPCAALECVIAAGHPAPATHFEEETLRMQSGYGPLGGTDVPKLAAGIKSRYGLVVQQVGTFAQLQAALTPGHSAFVIVQPSRLPSSNALRLYVGTAFTALHFIHLANEGSASLRRLDPAAPAGYPGDSMSWADLKTCYVGGAGVLPLALAAGGSDMVPALATDATPKIASFPAGESLYDLDGKTALAPKVPAGSYQTGVISPFAVEGGLRALWVSWSVGKFKLCLAAPITGSVKDLPAGFSQADIDAAVAEAKAAVKNDIVHAIQAI
jgi:hypothetical protein